MTSLKDGGEVQFRKGSREFGERSNPSRRRPAVRGAHSPASISCMGDTHRRSRVQIVDRIRIASVATKDHAMKYRQMLLSGIGFAVVIFGVAWLDPRVRQTRAADERRKRLTSWDNRALGCVEAMAAAPL